MFHFSQIVGGVSSLASWTGCRFIYSYQWCQTVRSIIGAWSMCSLSSHFVWFINSAPALTWPTSQYVFVIDQDALPVPWVCWCLCKLVVPRPDFSCRYHTLPITKPTSYRITALHAFVDNKNTLILAALQLTPQLWSCDPGGVDNVEADYTQKQYHSTRIPADLCEL